MPAAQRNFPYIWATWLPRLLTGERSCEWAIWFKARHQGWNRKPSDFKQADWLARHTALLNEHRDRWIQSGYDVRVENQNAFQLRGHSAILAGKPDLLVLNKNRILVIDFKTGQELPWHKFQVMTYMYAMPKALPEYRHFKFAGEIVYNNRTERVPQGGIDQVSRASAGDPPKPKAERKSSATARRQQQVASSVDVLEELRDDLQNLVESWGDSFAGTDRYQRFSAAVAVIEEAVAGLGDLDLSWNGR